MAMHRETGAAIPVISSPKSSSVERPIVAAALAGRPGCPGEMPPRAGVQRDRDGGRPATGDVAEGPLRARGGAGAGPAPVSRAGSSRHGAGSRWWLVALARLHPPSWRTRSSLLAPRAAAQPGPPPAVQPRPPRLRLRRLHPAARRAHTPGPQLRPRPPPAARCRAAGRAAAVAPAVARGLRAAQRTSSSEAGCAPAPAAGLGCRALERACPGTQQASCKRQSMCAPGAQHDVCATTPPTRQDAAPSSSPGA
jgi:hypothetical protein